MSPWLLVPVVGLSAVACLVLLVLLVRDRSVGDPVFVVLGLLELLLVVQLVAGSLALSGTGRDVSGVLFVSYLVGVVLALPVGFLWWAAEQTRAGTAVLLAATFTVIALELRLDAIWDGSGA